MQGYVQDLKKKTFNEGISVEFIGFKLSLLFFFTKVGIGQNSIPIPTKSSKHHHTYSQGDRDLPWSMMKIMKLFHGEQHNKPSIRERWQIANMKNIIGSKYEN